MPCLACADRILGIFLREIASSNGRYTTSRVAYMPKWFSAQRRIVPHVGQSLESLPVATSSTPKIDLYVPFDESLTANEAPPLSGKIFHPEHGESNCQPPSLLAHIRKDDTHEAFNDGVNRVELGREASTMVPQGAINGGGHLARAIKSSHKIFGAPRPERNRSLSWLSGSPKDAPGEPRGDHALVELSPIAVDAIAAEANTGKSMHILPLQDGDRGKKGISLGTLTRVVQKDARAEGGIATMTTSYTGDKFRPRVELWRIQKDALEAKFGTGGWNPRKRLSPDALDGIRALNAQFPDKYTTPVLAEQFKVSPEAIRRILKSKWRPSDEEAEERRARWDKRGEKIWHKMVELGAKPPKKWREMGVGKRRTDVARSRHRSLGERGPRKPLNSAGCRGLRASWDDWGEETLAERVL